MADLNGDDKPDVVVASSGRTQTDVIPYLGKGDVSFTQASPLTGTSIGDPFGLVVTDLNGDGAPDVAEGVYSGAEIPAILGSVLI